MHDDLLAAKPAQEHGHERVERKVDVDDVGVSRLFADRAGECPQPARQWQIVCGDCPDASTPRESAAADNDGARFGEMFDKLAEVAIESARLLGEPTLADHQDPKGISRVVGRFRHRSCARFICTCVVLMSTRGGRSRRALGRSEDNVRSVAHHGSSP